MNLFLSEDGTAFFSSSLHIHFLHNRREFLSTRVALTFFYLNLYISFIPTLFKDLDCFDSSLLLMTYSLLAVCALVAPSWRVNQPGSVSNSRGGLSRSSSCVSAGEGVDNHTTTPPKSLFRTSQYSVILVSRKLMEGWMIDE